jgi:peptide/nickel transport system substrate-binding protein
MYGYGVKRCTVAIILIAVVMAGCSDSRNSGRSMSSSSGNTQTISAEKDGLVVIYGQASLNTLDPQTHAGTALASILSNMFENMVRRTENGLEPQLATSWEQRDALTWDFTLRDDVSFHNGEKFNADVMKFSLERAMSPVILAKNAHNFTTIDKVDVLDEYHLRITTKVEDPLLLGKVASWPACAVPPEYLAEVGDDQFGLAPIGTGPYKFVRCDAGRDLYVEAVDAHWEGVPKIKKVQWRVVSEASSRMAELQSGNADIVENVPYDLIDIINMDPSVEVLNSWNIRTVYLQLDYESPPTNNKLVRQAIAYSIDVDSLINDLLMGNGRRIASYSIPEVAYHNADLTPYPYDVNKARELLVEAGFGNSPLPLTFDISIGRVPMDKELCEAVTGMLNDTGLFSVNLIINESGVYSDKANKKELPHDIGQITLATHGNYTYDPDFTLSRSFSYVDPPRAILASHQNNKEWDAIIRQAGVETNDAKRRELTYQMQELIKEDCPRIYLYQQRATWGISANLNWTPSGELIDLRTITWK